MDCRYELTCKNTDKCYRCINESLLRLPKQKMKTSRTAKFDYKEANKENSWENLEQSIADSLNQIPTIQEARRSIRSGALFEKGDIVDSILHPECKERTGKELKSGEKSMSIKREWLEKARDECKYTNKAMCLPFRFKGDDTIYNIMTFNDIAGLVTTMKAYIIDNERMQATIDGLNKEIDELKRMLNNKE